MREGRLVILAQDCILPTFSAISETSLRAMAKAMKAMRAAKALKAMKRVSTIAKGKLAKAVVFRGNKAKTQSGLKKMDLFKNKRGKIVSKKASAAGKKRFGAIKGWLAAVQKARKALGVKGFFAIKKGSPLYKKAKEFYGN